MIESLCKKIKEKRRELGYSLEEVVKKTKLHPSVIKDIENCNLDKITPIFVKGFIKIYAAFLGVELKDELSQIKTTSDSQFKRPQKKREPGQGRVFKFFSGLLAALSKIPLSVRKNILFAAVALIIFWLGFLGIRFSFRKVLTFFRSRPKVEEKELIKDKEPELPLERRLDTVRASLTVERDCFIRAFVDGEIIFEGVLKRGEVKSWQAQEELELEIRDGSAVRLEVDGEAIPRLSSLRQPKSLIINSSGITID